MNEGRSYAQHGTPQRGFRLVSVLWICCTVTFWLPLAPAQMPPPRDTREISGGGVQTQGLFAVTQHAAAGRTVVPAVSHPPVGPQRSSGWLSTCGLAWLLLIGIYKRVTVAKRT